MRIWKYVVLLGGVLGVLGFFAPFLELRAPDGSLAGASAYEIATGRLDVSGLLAQAQQLGVVSAAEAERALRLVERSITAYRAIFIACFVPAGLLSLVGLVALARRRMGRLAGLTSVVAGLAALGVWIFFFQAPDAVAGAASRTTQTTGQLGLGVYALAVGGLLGLVGGAGALFAPDRGPAAAG